MPHAFPTRRSSDWPNIGAARLVPETEIEAIISPIGGVVPLVMRRRYQPAPRRSMDERARKHLPPHMIADAHHRHDREQESEHSDMARDQEDKISNDDTPREPRPRAKATHHTPN